MAIPPGPTGPPAPTRKKSNTGAIIFLVVVCVLLAGVGFLAWKQGKSSPDSAKAGDCVARSGQSDVKVVKCTDTAAAYRVVGKIDGKTRIDFSIGSATICKPFPAAKSAYWKGETGKPGYVLCLSPNK